MKLNSIGILGCGWLGLPLAAKMVQKGYLVNGSVTQADKLSELQAANIKPYIIHFNPEINKKHKPDFFDVDLLFINIPPGRKNHRQDYFIDIVKNIIGLIKQHGIQNVIFISSTSVYPDTNSTVNEDFKGVADKSSGKTLQYCENLLLDVPGVQTRIIRFGGLIGGERKPGRFLAGKQGVSGGGSPVNLIHRDDCIEIILSMLRTETKSRIFNAAMPKHPTREAFYSAAAKKLGIAAPVFEKDTNPKYKIIDSSRLMKELKYEFIFNDPVECL